MRLTLTIIFSFLVSLSYAQPADWGYWETVPLKSVKMLTPKMIKENLNGTAWQYMCRVKWKVQNGKIWESKFVRSFPIFDSGWFFDIYIEEDKIYQYKHFFGSKESVEKTTKYSHNNEYGITIVSLDEEFRQKFEPNTAKYEERIASLKALHDAGFYTWVSIEPYPTPNMIDQSLEEILKAVSFADKIIFGRLHYNKEVSAYKKHKEFFNEQAKQVIEFCEQNKKAYHIKNGTITK